MIDASRNKGVNNQRTLCYGPDPSLFFPYELINLSGTGTEVSPKLFLVSIISILSFFYFHGADVSRPNVTGGGVEGVV